MGTDRARLGPEDPYIAILELARIEHDLLDEGRLEELQTLDARWDELTAGLPETPPAHARDPLRKAVAMHTRMREMLLTRRAAMLAELDLARQGGSSRGGVCAQREQGRLEHRSQRLIESMPALVRRRAERTQDGHGGDRAARG